MKIKPQKSRKRGRKSIQRFRFILGTLLGFSGLYYLSFHDYGIIQHFETQEELRLQKARRENLKQENATIREDLEKLKSDDNYIEKIARERYHLAREGEQVYSIQKGQPADSLKQQN